MSDRLIITFNKYQDDIPVLIVGRENSFAYLSGGTSIVVENVFTGDEAVALWNKLRKKEKQNDNRTN